MRFWRTLFRVNNPILYNEHKTIPQWLFVIFVFFDTLTADTGAAISFVAAKTIRSELLNPVLSLVDIFFGGVYRASPVNPN